MKRRFRGPSPALVISIVALAMASAGTAVALTKITSSRQIAKNVVNSGDIRDKTLQVRDTSQKLREMLTGQRGASGQKGDTGDPAVPLPTRMSPRQGTSKRRTPKTSPTPT